jgi:hypothetical protein
VVDLFYREPPPGNGATDVSNEIEMGGISIPTEQTSCVGDLGGAGLSRVE